MNFKSSEDTEISKLMIMLKNAYSEIEYLKVKNQNQKYKIRVENDRNFDTLRNWLEIFERENLEKRQENRKLHLIITDLEERYNKLKNDHNVILNGVSEEVDVLKRKLRYVLSNPEPQQVTYGSSCDYTFKVQLMRKMREERMILMQMKRRRSMTEDSTTGLENQLCISVNVQKSSLGHPKYNLGERLARKFLMRKQEKEKEVSLHHFETLRQSLETMRRSVHRNDLECLRMKDALRNQRMKFEKEISEMKMKMERKEKKYQNQILNLIQFFDLNGMYSK